MKKLFILVVIVLVASMAFGQRPQDSKLGPHDVMSSDNSNRLGCQSCHIPHHAGNTEYIFKYVLPTNIVDHAGATLDSTDTNAFHSLACMSCHDGVTASDIIANNFGSTPSTNSAVLGANLSHDHPVHETYSQRGTTFNGNFVSFRADGITNTATKGTTGYNYGYVECGTCHDPHKGDSATYKFLRGPSATKPAYASVSAAPTGTTLTTYYAGYGYTYTATDSTWARLGLCRDCHGK